MLLEKWVSRKLLVALVALILFVVYGQFEAAATIATGYVLGQGVVDGLDKWSFNKGQADVQSVAIMKSPTPGE